MIEKQPGGQVCAKAGEAQVAAADDTAGPPNEFDIDLAQHAVRVHCAISWPEGLQCNNCQAPFPCVTHRWGRQLLERANWDEEQIVALDARVGPWS